ncbi:ATP-binding protein [Arthrobacter sp. PAMC25564]|uniref:ATP-binding protein n=1 Tax=Arthrobacter sp. PAMC25564 TaxID=2565366 RepID=UPI001F109AAD|nr:ATP-binding protein [Arthrobacter sp. PAMC25564]
MGRVTTTNTAAPRLPADLEVLMRSLKMTPARALAPELIAAARAQRREPVEDIKALVAEEAAGRARSMLASRRKAAGFPAGKTFDAWDPAVSSVPAPIRQTLGAVEWITRRENLIVCGGSVTGKTFFLEALGVLIRVHRADDSVTRAVSWILRAELVVIDDMGRWQWTPAKASTGSLTGCCTTHTCVRPAAIPSASPRPSPERE